MSKKTTKKTVKRQFEIPKTVFALIWKHSDGWTFQTFTYSVDEAREYIKKYNPPSYMCEWKIIPCKVETKIKTPFDKKK